MIIAFFVLSGLICAGLLVAVPKIKEFEHPTQRYIQYALVCSAVSVMANALAAIMRAEWLALLFFGICLVAVDGMFIALLLFAKICTRAQGANGLVRFLIYGSTLMDMCSMIVNAFTRHAFACEKADFFGHQCYRFVPVFPQGGPSAYVLHLIFIGLLMFLVLLTFIVRMLRLVKLYRGRYMAVIWTFVLIWAANIIYRFQKVPIDISPVLYAFLAVATMWTSLFYVPNAIMVKLLSLTAEDMENGIMCYDRNGHCLYANEKARKLFNAMESYTPLDKYFTSWKAGRELEELREGGWKEERIVDDELRNYDMFFKFLMDEKGKYVGSFFTAMDRTEEYREMEIERYNATHDYLTDIYNRDRFFEKVAEILKRKPDIKRVMVCIDVKDFKVVNDLFGEETGNRILKRIAGLMRRDASPDTIYGRLEADRFAMCMQEEDFHEEDFPIYLEDLKKIVNSSMYRMHVHVGVYHIVDPTMSISVMCDKAFVAIRRIKESYQQVVSHYSEDMGYSAQMEKIMVGEFDRALAAGEFRMFLQPQVAVDGGAVLGAEALVRWEHPVRGMVSPGEFIPVFEKSGYIARLDNYIWELACKQLREWKDQGRDDLHISVNISPRDFYFVDIYDTFTSLVERYEIKPSNLKLEITETALMEEMSKQLDLLKKIRDYGFQVEIDDFGSGYSSLNTLQDIEVDVLKLDMGFLRKTSHEERSRTIMNAVINMSKNLGLTVVTEGVETVAQVEYLTKAGCDIFQGYYFSKPIPVKEFEKKYFLDK